MKKCTSIIVALVLSGLYGCSAEKPDAETEPLLKSFSLESGDKNHHASLNHEAGTAQVRGIKYGASVSGVKYSLAEGASIAPDPKTFVGQWPDRQDFTIADGRRSAVYSVILPDYEGILPQGGEVIFEDDFEQASSAPDPTKWTLVPPGGSPWSKHMSGSPEQSFVEDGKLVLIAEKVDGEYKAGGVQSKDKAYFRNAKVEVSARFVTTAKGAWPAIWMMPQNPIYKGWPDCGEIDIMEQLNHDKFVYQTVHSNYLDDLKIKDPKPDATPPYNAGMFNTYAVDMTDEELVFYVNGIKTHSYPNLHLEDEALKMQWPFSCNFYLILNLALGGEGTWPGAINDSELPARMEVDWVRVSKL